MPAQTNSDYRIEGQEAEVGHGGPLARVFAVLGFVAEKRRAVAIAEIAEGLSLATPTAHRIVANLEEQGYLRRGLDSKRVIPGRRLISFAGKVTAATLSDASRHALLQKVANLLNEQVELALIRKNTVVYLDNVRPVRPASLQFEPGRRAPLHCTSTGKLFLSRLPPRLRHKLARTLPLSRFTNNTIIDPERLLRELEVVRERGYATNDEEMVEGVVGCAVPVLDAEGEMIAGLGVTVPLTRVPKEGTGAYVPALRDAAEKVSASLDEL